MIHYDHYDEEGRIIFSTNVCDAAHFFLCESSIYIYNDSNKITKVYYSLSGSDLEDNKQQLMHFDIADSNDYDEVVKYNDKGLPEKIISKNKVKNIIFEYEFY